MNVVITFAAIAIALFISAYVTRRRFGLLGLALAAGSILSVIWSYDAGLVVGALGVFPSGPLTTAATLSVIVLLPPVILLFHGYAYKSVVGRIFGALMFTAVAMAFLIEPLSHAMTLTGTGASAYNWLIQNKDTVISFGMVIAVLDLFMTKPAHLNDKKSRR